MALLLVLGCGDCPGSVFDEKIPEQSLPSTRVSRHEYEVRTWTTDDGLPQNKIQALYQSRDGYLWVGTQQGLARFDGDAFTAFDASTTPGLPSDTCLSLGEDSTRALWIGTTKGLYRYQQRQFSLIPGTDIGSETNRYQFLLPGEDNQVYAGTVEDVRLLQGDRVKELHRLGPEFGSLQNLASVRGRLWATSRSTVYRWNGSSAWETIFKAEGFIFRPGTLTGDEAGRVWWGSERGLYCWQPDGLERWIDAAGESTRIEHVAAEGNAIWCATDRGVTLFDDNMFYRFSVPQLATETVETMLVDREGNVWLGTSRGLIQLRRLPFVTHSRRHGLDSDDVWSVCEGPDGTVWAGTGAGIWRLEGDRWKQVPFETKGMPNRTVRTVFVDSASNVWAGVSGLFTHVSNGVHQPFVPANSEPIRATVRGLYEHPKGTVWLGMDHGLGRLEVASRKIHLETSLSLYTGLLTDNSGALWIGAKPGLTCWKRGRWFIYSRTNGLTSDQCFPLLAERGDVMWAGSEHGLNRVRTNGIDRITVRQGLPENVILGMLLDDRGFAWLSGHRGIHRISKQDLDDVANGKRARLRSETFTEADGLLSTECNGTTFPHSCRTRDGRLWFPTIRGVAVVNPRKLGTNQAGPQIIIQQLRAGENTLYDHGNLGQVDRNGVLRVPAKNASIIRIEYTAATFANARKAKFRHQLRGLDESPLDVGTRRTAGYTYLKPGLYEFVVWAADHRGVWNEAGKRLRFKIEPHYYQTHWFQAGVAAGLLGVVLAGHWLRLGRLRELAALEHRVAVDRDRTRIAENMHDHLGSTATRIKLLIERANIDKRNPAAVSDALVKLNQVTRELVRDMDQVVWVVNPQKDTLQELANYVVQYSQDYVGETNIRCRLDIPTILPQITVSAETRHHVLLFVKEALHNVLKHSQATEVTVSMYVQAERETCGEAARRAGTRLLSLTVCDNGKGFPVPAPARQGNGLASMRHRAAALEGEFKTQSTPGRGTTISLEVPLRPEA